MDQAITSIIDIKKSFQHMLEIEHNIKKDINIFYLKGFLEFNNYIYLQNNLIDVLKDIEPKIIFNFEDLKFIDSSGMQLIVFVYKKLLEKRYNLKICCCNSNITKIFNLCNFNDRFDIFNNEIDAIKSFNLLNNAH